MLGGQPGMCDFTNIRGYQKEWGLHNHIMCLYLH